MNQYKILNLKEIQGLLFEMAKNVTSILDTYQIQYSICFGTLLGAVRHSGFIPWDDDFDIFIMDEDYDKALDILSKELDTPYLVHSLLNDANYFHAWNRIIHTNTKTVSDNIYHEDNKRLKFHCLAIDIYRFKKIKNCEFVDYKLHEARLFLDRKFKMGLISREEASKVMKNMTEELEDIKQNNSNEEIATMVILKRGIPVESIFPLDKIIFENHFFSSPQDPNTFLSIVYGEYMLYPEIEQRKPHNKIVYLKNDF